MRITWNCVRKDCNSVPEAPVVVDVGADRGSLAQAMKLRSFPFEAIVHQDEMKLCLCLSAVDWRISVLLRGDKGSGKSTAARALAGVLPEAAPFVNVPIGATEDRLLGSLDLQAAMRGELALRRGLIDEAHRGVLYLDEVNLLPGHLADALLDVSATGLYVLERDGISHSRACEFCLLGSMNLEEGQLRPQLLDRFAICLDVYAPRAPEQRSAIIQQRMRYDHTPDAFVEAFHAMDRGVTAHIQEARALLPSVEVTPQTIEAISRHISEVGVRSLRADLAALRAARALAAWQASDKVTDEHVQAVLPLVLRHRASSLPPPSSAPPHPTVPPQTPQPKTRLPSEESDRDSTEESSPSTGSDSCGVEERVFEPTPVAAPRLTAQFSKTWERSGRAKAKGETLRSIDGASSHSVDVVRSLTKAAITTGVANLRHDTLEYRRQQHTSGSRYLFVVDASGSQAARGRMKSVKGIALGLLEASSRAEDEVGIIAFRGASASVLLPPSHSVELARQRLELLPTGGRTPLADALRLSREWTTSNTVLILVSDGQANVPISGGDPWEEAMREASLVECPVLLVDDSTSSRQAERLSALAQVLRATRCTLEDLETLPLVHLTARES